jgi:hypothetical protein
MQLFTFEGRFCTMKLVCYDGDDDDYNDDANDNDLMMMMMMMT